MVHYSIFMGVHLAFIVVLLGSEDPFGSRSGQGFGSLAGRFDTWETVSLVIALGSLIIEHGYEFVSNYWLGGGYKKTLPAIQMFSPYGRIVVLHLAILFGGFLFVFFHLPRLMVVLLVALKIGFELRKGPSR